MSRFSIYSKNGATIRYSGTPTYNGSYLNPSYLEFREISSPTLIPWQVGDYVDYDRTGMRYKLYFLPQPTKKARTNTSGESYVYSNVQFFADTKQLQIAPFRDLVLNDNLIHYSTQQAISTFENVFGIADRLQANMDDFAPNKWEFRVFAPSRDYNNDYNEDYTITGESILTEAREFTISGGSVLDALNKIYDIWNETGWVHTIEDGVNVITIGKLNSFNVEDATNIFKYGQGLGLKSIKKTQANVDEMATRLYVFGSNKNLFNDYYKGLDIHNAESVDIQNLMLPLSVWGLNEEDEKPDARLAYIENEDAIELFGLIPKTIYFDGGDNGEIYPTIEENTIGILRDAKEEAGDTEYVPSETIYPNRSERIDEIKSAVNPTDDGTTSKSGKIYLETEEVEVPLISLSKSIAVGGDDTFSLDSSATDISVVSGDYESNLTITSDIVGTLTTDNGISSKVELQVFVDDELRVSQKLETKRGSYTFSIPDITIGGATGKIPAESEIKVVFLVTGINTDLGNSHNIVVSIPSGTMNFNFSHYLPNSFSLTLKQIGFDISKRAKLGESIKIAFKDGNCAGRSFQIKKVVYQPTTDDWLLTMFRGYDESLDMYFPNSTYSVNAGDHFAIINIAMPEEYIYMATQKLLIEGQKILANTSRIVPYYEPDVDAKKMVENLILHEGDERYILREGKYFGLMDSDIVGSGIEYVIIDSLTINEGESNIPTYKVSLREKKKLSFQQKTANAISSIEQKVVDNTGKTISVNENDGLNYENLANLPSIDNVELKGNLRSKEDLGLLPSSDVFDNNGKFLNSKMPSTITANISGSASSATSADHTEAIIDSISSNEYKVAIVSSVPTQLELNTFYILI